MDMDTCNRLLILVEREFLLGYHVSFSIIYRIVEIFIPLNNAAPLPGRAIVNIDHLAWLILINTVLHDNAKHIFTDFYSS